MNTRVSARLGVATIVAVVSAAVIASAIPGPDWAHAAPTPKPTAKPTPTDDECEEPPDFDDGFIGTDTPISTYDFGTQPGGFGRSVPLAVPDHCDDPEADEPDRPTPTKTKQPNATSTPRSKKISPCPKGDGSKPATLRMCEAARRNSAIVHRIGCYDDRAGDHGAGYACDFMVAKIGNMPTAEYRQIGQDLADWAKKNAKKYGIRYVIYRQKIWNIKRAREGWRKMGNRGSITENHYDHVHISMAWSGN